MSERTEISWADSTFNPFIGCTKVSPGCAHCYAAELDDNRYSKTMDGGTKEKPVSHWGPGAPRHRTSAALWKQPLKWNREAWKANEGLLAMDHIRPRIFPSLCDWLDEEVPIEWLADFLKLIHDTPNLDWLLLSKRPESFTARTKSAWTHLSIHCGSEIIPDWLKLWMEGSPPSNVWFGVSVEDQKRADERIPLLLQIPAKVRFLSVEPLLEEVDLSAESWSFLLGEDKTAIEGVDWVIVGGESGNNRRDCGVEPICDIARQCVAAGVPVHVKQDCAFKPGQQGRIPDAVWALKQSPVVQ